MQNNITEETLTKLGINLDGQDIVSLLSHLNDTLEERIGAEMADALDDEQLQMLAHLQDTANDETVGQWLRTNVAEFDQIVQDEIDILLGELAENSEGINNIISN